MLAKRPNGEATRLVNFPRIATLEHKTSLELFYRGLYLRYDIRRGLRSPCIVGRTSKALFCTTRWQACLAKRSV